MGVFGKKWTPNLKGKIVISTWDKVDWTILSSLDKKKCYCKTKWQIKVEWLGMVENLNSYSWQEITKDLWVKFWIRDHENIE
jgi:hypothetical protein